MNTVRDIAFFILANALGFFASAISYNVAILTGLFSPDNPDLDLAMFQTMFFTGTMMTWAACGLFSLGFFFIKENFRILFIAAPALIPLFYGLSVLVRFSAPL